MLETRGSGSSSCCRRRILRHPWRFHSSDRAPRSPAAVKGAATVQPIPSASAELPMTTLQTALHGALGALEAGDLERALGAVACSLDSSDAWTPPTFARRKGALWLIPASHLRAARAAARWPPPVRTESTTSGMFSVPVPRLACEPACSLPCEAQRLLAAHEAFVLREHGLWPAAEARWGRRDFLEAELCDVSCAVLSAPSHLKDFLYWLPPRRHRSLEEAMARGSDRVLAPYEFDEPNVSQVCGARGARCPRIDSRGHPRLTCMLTPVPCSSTWGSPTFSR